MKGIALLLFLATTTLFSQSQTDLSYYLPQDVEYNASIPTPHNVIGHDVGEWHITHDKLVYYMQALAQLIWTRNYLLMRSQHLGIMFHFYIR